MSANRKRVLTLPGRHPNLRHPPHPLQNWGSKYLRLNPRPWDVLLTPELTNTRKLVANSGHQTAATPNCVLAMSKGNTAWMCERAEEGGGGEEKG